MSRNRISFSIVTLFCGVLFLSATLQADPKNKGHKASNEGMADNSHLSVDIGISGMVTAGIDLVLVVSGSLVISDILEGVFD